jgi:hypothetical protein
MKIIVEKVKQDKVLQVIRAKYLKDYVVRVVFNDGTEKAVDFKSFLQKTTHPEIAKYRKENLFKKFRIESGNINWNDYDLIFPISDLYKGIIN